MDWKYEKKIVVTWLVYGTWRLLHDFHDLSRYFKFLRYIVSKKQKICTFVYKVTDIFNTTNTWFLLLVTRR